MSLILNIDTAEQQASVCLAADGTSLLMRQNDNQQDHAAWLHSAIDSLFRELAISLNQLDAVAVAAGPGSYTGLRVGMSAAKGLCYALQVPFITVNSLLLQAAAVAPADTELIWPMIDARRMEVFTAIYSCDLQELAAPQAMILDKSVIRQMAAAKTVTCCGSGSLKLQPDMVPANCNILHVRADAGHLAALAHAKWIKNELSDAAYTEPVYVKEFYSPERK